MQSLSGVASGEKAVDLLHPPELDVIHPPWVVHDRVQEFVVSHQVLLCRPLVGKTRTWQVVHLPRGRIPFQVKADFENLMVLDTKRDVHYAKSFEDGKSTVSHLDWHSGIWDLPVIGEIFNRIIYKDPNFKVYEGESWGCSFLESGCNYLDGAGRRHELGDGWSQIGTTTTAYVADNKHRVFRFYDPFLPKTPEDKETLYIPYPETSTTTFEVKGMASCRSGIFAIGYDVKAAQGGGVDKTLSLYYIRADANLLGLNPMISYSYAELPPKAADFVLPAVTYQKIPLPDCVRLSSVVGMERLFGALMTDVAFTVEGIRKKGNQGNESGYFYLRLKEMVWDFKAAQNHSFDVNSLLKEKISDPGTKFTTQVVDCSGKSSQGFSAELKNFGKNSLVSKITVTIDKNNYEMTLCRKPSQWDIIGFDLTDFTIVATPEIAKLLGWDDPIFPVVTKLDSGTLSILHNKAPLFEFKIF